MLCPVCNEPAKSVCSACLQVSYCSSEHQKEDWKSHKKTCSPFIIKQADESRPELGCQWFATRNLKAGIILLDESPAVHEPKFSSKMDFEDEDFIPVCLTCALNMTMEKDSRCSICNWPLCSYECEKMPIHAENECKIFADKKIPYPPPSNFSPTEISLCLLMIRGISLKKTNTTVYDELMKLQHVHATPDAMVDTVYPHACDKLKKLIGQLDGPDEEYERIVRLSSINGFTVDYQEENKEHTMFRNRTGNYVYLKTSRMNHSCVPNCTRSIGQKPNFIIRVRTSIPVQKGQPLTICYGEAGDNFLGTVERQKKMKSGGGFICRCERCLDPTEMGTMMSAILCSACVGDDQPGYVLPKDPLDTSESAVWVCNQCHSEKKVDELSTLSEVSVLASIIEEVAADPLNMANGKLETFCDTVMMNFGQRLLHENHWVLQAAARASIKAKTPKMMRMNHMGYAKYVELSLYLLTISDKICPGISFDRGIILLYASRALAELVSKYSKELSKALRTEYLTLCQKLQVDAYEYHKTDVAPQGETFSYDAQSLKSEMQSVQMLRILELG